MEDTNPTVKTSVNLWDEFEKAQLNHEHRKQCEREAAKLLHEENKPDSILREED